MLESKKNCAKIGTIIRMSMKKSDSNVAPQSAAEAIAKVRLNDGKVNVYVPHMIENDKATSYVKDFNSMYKNSLKLFITNISVDIDLEKGFYDDPSGKLWPKVFKISLSFDTDSPNRLMKNYFLNNQSRPSTYNVLLDEEEEGYEPQTFPFSRASSKATTTVLR